ncbi:hypothetical protein VTN00DRAFT_8605 [Thermoascus crustaceus]
MTGKCKQELLA